MMPTGTSNPIKRPITPANLAREIACELRSGPRRRYEDVIEEMIMAALRNGGVKSHD